MQTKGQAHCSAHPHHLRNRRLGALLVSMSSSRKAWFTDVVLQKTKVSFEHAAFQSVDVSNRVELVMQPTLTLALPD